MEPFDAPVFDPPQIEGPELEPEPILPEPEPETIVLDQNFDSWLSGKAGTIKYKGLKV